ncbi:hypothetical protein NL676_037428 [Syzygium grande]|nr:hypothetical protein NL676_037428 [Syzygium grande]
MLRGVTAVVLAMLSTLAYQGIRPPPLKTCGSPGGPPITATRVRLRDGQYLAYKEQGVPRELAKHKIIFVHDSNSCRHNTMIAQDVSLVVNHVEVDCSNQLDLGEEDIAVLDGSVAGQGNKKAVRLLVGLLEVLGGKVALKEVEGGGGGVGVVEVAASMVVVVERMLRGVAALQTVRPSWRPEEDEVIATEVSQAVLEELKVYV